MEVTFFPKEIQDNPKFQLGFRYPWLFDALMSVTETQQKVSGALTKSDIFQMSSSSVLIHALINAANELDLHVDLLSHAPQAGSIGFRRVARLNNSNPDAIGNAIRTERKFGRKQVLQLTSNSMPNGNSLTIELEE